MPAALYSCQHVFLGNVSYPGLVVIFRVVRIDHSIDFVLSLPEPALLLIMHYDLYLRFGTDDIALICDCDGERSSEHSAKMCGWMCELVFLIASALDVDKESKVMCAWCYSYARPGEFGTELVETAHADAFDGAIDEEGGDWRVVGGLLGKVGNPDRLVAGVDMLCGGLFVRFSQYWWNFILYFPIALMRWSMKEHLGQEGLQIPERILPMQNCKACMVFPSRISMLFMSFFSSHHNSNIGTYQVLREPKPKHLEHAYEAIIRVANAAGCCQSTASAGQGWHMPYECLGAI